MSSVIATRTELLARKRRIELARQGQSLLKQKQEALMNQLMRIQRDAMEGVLGLEETANTARRALARAYMLAGPEAVWSAALASQQDLTLTIEHDRVMGVSVPAIEQPDVVRTSEDRPYSSLGLSPAIDEAARAFETEVEAILMLATAELQMRRLLDEIQRTMRRLNVLEQVLIPRLEAERDAIQAVLGERERLDHFRLKMVKRALRGDRQSPLA